ncbi:transposase family protein [Streptomyces sp. NPDC002690]
MSVPPARVHELCCPPRQPATDSSEGDPLPVSDPIWISACRPGRTRDATAARRDKIVEHLKAAGLGALADLGFDKPDDPDDLVIVIVTGYKATRARKLTPGQKQADRVLAAARAPVEHGFAKLKAWRIFTKLRTDPARGHRPPASTARPDRPRSQPLTVSDDQESRLSPAISVSIPKSTTPAPPTSTFEVGEASLPPTPSPRPVMAIVAAIRPTLPKMG